jgi:hypothetical protein
MSTCNGRSRFSGLRSICPHGQRLRIVCDAVGSKRRRRGVGFGAPIRRDERRRHRDSR